MYIMRVIAYLNCMFYLLLFTVSFTEIPRIVSNNGTSVSVSRNDSIVLSFSITQAVPPVTPDNIVWTITNSSGTFDLGSGEGDNYVFSEDRLTLRIQRARRVDAGTYSVDVSNAVGTASAEITLMVTGGKLHTTGYALLQYS